MVQVGDVPFFNDWLLKTEPDPYWTAIDGIDRARNIQGRQCS